MGMIQVADLPKRNYPLKYFYGFLAIVTFILPGCEPDETPTVKEIDYFSFNAGAFQVYSISETVYNELKDPEMLSYQLKVQLVDSFPNAENGYTYVLSRMRRDQDAGDWENLDTWSVRTTERELIVNEGNLAFVKLMTPARVELTWDGNKFNNEGDDEYEITAVDEPITLGGMTFDETVTITQESNDDRIVFLDERKEVYARNIGLVYKELTQLNFCTQDQCLGQQIIENGRILKQELIEYGDQ